MKVGITGANGFIGSHLVAEFLDQGWEVRVLIRASSRLESLAGLSVEYFVGDVRNAENIENFISGLDVLVHNAAITSAPSREEIWTANVLGTQKLLEACRSVSNTSGKELRFVFISSQEAAGLNPDPEKPLDESMPLKPITDYGKSKAAAEALVSAATLPTVILRPSPVYGPRDRDTRMFFEGAAIRLRVVPLFKSRLSMVYVGNLVKAMVAAATAPAAIGKAYYIADSQPLSWRRMFKNLQQFYGSSRWLIPLWKPALSFIVTLLSTYSSLTGKRQILNRDKYQMVVAPNLTVSIAAAQRDLGYTAPFDTAQAMYNTALWYRQNQGL